MKKGEEEKPKTSSQVWTALAILAVAALLGAIFWLYRGQKKTADDLARSKDEYGQLLDLKKKVDSVQQRAGGGKPKPPPQDPADLPSYFTEKAAACGIAKVAVRVPEGTGRWGGWSEYAYTITFGERESTATRPALAAFLQTVEQERPYLKTKSLTVKFGEPNAASGNVVISFFKSQGR